MPHACCAGACARAWGTCAARTTWTPGQPGALAVLSRLCLLRGDTQRAGALAKAALDAAQTDGVRAAALGLQARAHHAAGAFAEARACYEQARRITSAAPFPVCKQNVCGKHEDQEIKSWSTLFTLDPRRPADSGRVSKLCNRTD